MIKPHFFREVGFFFLNYLLYNPGGIMGKKRRAMKFPQKFGNKFGRKFASVLKIETKQEVVKPEPEPIVEEVVVAAKPEPIVEKPVPKVTKKAPVKRKTTTKRKVTKKSTTKRTKRTTVKKDK
tara:strand:+ start:784 stop:1152 length:369 start_codon:yes stop_codon:yes gene_type:complete